MPEAVLVQETQAVAAPVLTVHKPDSLRQELGLVDPKTVQVTEDDKQLTALADEFTSKLMSIDPHDLQMVDTVKNTALSLGSGVQQQLARKSALLMEPIRTLSRSGADGGQVANCLIDLKLQVEKLDPYKFDFEPGWFSRFFGLFGMRLKKYFTQFESSQTVLDAILRSLLEGGKQLLRDNETLKQDQLELRALSLKLQRLIKLGRLIDKKLTEQLTSITDEERRRFIEEELLFPLRQRIEDLQQQLLVAQQGVLAIELIIRNNRELIRGVERAENVTINALRVAVTVSIALAHQKITLDKITAITAVTDDLLLRTSEQLRTQGVEIHKKASSAQLDVEKMKKAFTNITSAIEDISKFRRDALPMMARTIVEMDNLSKEAEGAIRRMEEGNKARPATSLIDGDAAARMIEID